MKLYEIPKNSKLRIEQDGRWFDATFHKIDGMYSLCTLHDKGQTFHLSAMAEMIKIGDHYELAVDNLD